MKKKSFCLTFCVLTNSCTPYRCRNTSHSTKYKTNKLEIKFYTNIQRENKNVFLFRNAFNQMNIMLINVSFRSLYSHLTDNIDVISLKGFRIQQNKNIILKSTDMVECGGPLICLDDIMSNTHNF